MLVPNCLLTTRCAVMIRSGWFEFQLSDCQHVILGRIKLLSVADMPDITVVRFNGNNESWRLTLKILLQFKLYFFCCRQR